MARFGNYRKQLHNRKRASFGKMGKRGWICLYVLICLGLVMLIFLTEDRIAALTKDLADSIARRAAVTEEPQEEPLAAMENIRVVLMGEENGIYRSELYLVGNREYTVERDGEKEQVQAGQAFAFLPEDNAKNGSCIRVASGEEGQISLADKDGTALTPGYGGVLEIWQEKDGYVLVNEVGLEEYLAGVLPSEMPESYGLEALKAQAVCARTYVYGRREEDGYPRYQAKVDDTVSYQAYNDQAPTALMREAVEQTTGQVLCCGDDPVDTLYYSTSCGVTQAGDLFGSDMNTEVLKSVYVGKGKRPWDWNTYLRSGDENAYEKDSRYFRWNVRLEMKKNQEQVVQKIISMRQAYPEDIEYSKALRSKIKKNKDKDAIEQFGDFRSMNILERNDGGAVETLQMEFENGEVIICKELHIRDILGAGAVSASLADGSDGGKVQRLYSSVFTWDVGKDGAYILYGGGFGHGVGMSQNGARALCAAGYSYDRILSFFYQGSSLRVL